MPAHTGAMYEPQTNTIVVPNVNFGSTMWERLTIVHEATHAVYDYNRIQAGAVLEEAGAYIAGACYEVLENPNGTPVATGPIWDAARNIALDLYPGRFRLIQWDEEPGVVDPAKLNLLTNAIMNSPTYASGIARRPKLPYLHDGGRI